MIKGIIVCGKILHAHKYFDRLKLAKEKREQIVVVTSTIGCRSIRNTPYLSLSHNALLPEIEQYLKAAGCTEITQEQFENLIKNENEII